jgi:hypothetical protein
MRAVASHDSIDLPGAERIPQSRLSKTEPAGVEANRVSGTHSHSRRGRTRLSAPSRARSAGSSLGRAISRLRTCSWSRSTRISISFDRSERSRSASSSRKRRNAQYRNERATLNHPFDVGDGRAYAPLRGSARSGIRARVKQEIGQIGDGKPGPHGGRSFRHPHPDRPNERVAPVRLRSSIGSTGQEAASSILDTRSSSGAGRPIHSSSSSGAATSSAKKRPMLQPSVRRMSSPQSHPVRKGVVAESCAGILARRLRLEHACHAQRVRELVEGDRLAYARQSRRVPNDDRGRGA